MLKNVGRQDAEDLQAGELAIPCPACPREGVNLPLDWRTRAGR